MSHSSTFRPEGCVGKTYDAITTGVSVLSHKLHPNALAHPLSQAGVVTQDLYEFADSVNRTIIGGYHQTIGFSGGYFLVRTPFLCLPIRPLFGLSPNTHLGRRS